MLVVENLTVGYSTDVDILQDVSLQVPQGQIVAVIGPNGAGKSTLLRAICGFLAPRRGRVRYGEHLLTGVPAYRMVELGISYLPQERTVFPHLSVEQNLRLGGWHFRRHRQRLQQAVERVLTLFPMLAARRKSKAGDLSGGMQKILEIARGLIPDPQLLIVDEPSVGLAPLVAKEIYAVLQRLRAQQLTVLLVDQNVREAVALADYIYVLELGRNRLEGSQQDFATNLHAMIKTWLQI